MLPVRRTGLFLNVVEVCRQSRAPYRFGKCINPFHASLALTCYANCFPPLVVEVPNVNCETRTNGPLRVNR
jgi:hypothetical protein